MRCKILISLLSAAALLTGSANAAPVDCAGAGVLPDACYAPADKDTLIKANAAEPESLDPIHVQTPYSAGIMLDIGEGLLSEDKSNKPVPGVAKSWELSKDGKTYTFHLRKDAKWSNGQPVTADDFVYSFRRVVNPKNASEMSYKFADMVNAADIMEGKKPVDSLGVTALDKYTVQIKLNNPSYFFLSVMADTVSFPVYRPAVEKCGEKMFSTGSGACAYISNGAYQLAEWVPNGHISITRNPHYWDVKNVSIKNVKFLPIVNRGSAYSQYEANQLDFVYYVPTANLASIKQKYGNQVGSTQWVVIEYLDYNMKKQPFKDNLKLRQALSMAINREAITKYVTRSGETPIYTLFAPSIENGRYENIAYDWRNWPMKKRIAKAKELYKEAGYSKDHPLEISMTYNTDEVHKKVLQAISQMWKNELGVVAKTVGMEFKAFLPIRQHQTYGGVARDGWIADFNTIDNFATLYTCGSPENNSGYCNKKYDALVRQAEKQPTADMAHPYYVQALKFVSADYPVIPLYTQSVIHLVKPYIVGYDIVNNHLDHAYDKWLSFRTKKQ